MVQVPMLQKRTISAYTPSNTDPETRERIFVQRHQLLRKTVRWCEESMLTGDKHHVLFIGPRGCGKTHLVSMIHDRVSKNPKLTDKMRIAWLGEDTVFTGLIDLVLEIADELVKAYPDEFAFDYRTNARSLSPNDAAEQILGEIVNRLGDRSILLIMENLDRAMRGLGDLGQKKWRAFLQEQGRVATVATSQQLFEDVSSRDAAFYGFFEIIHLEPLSVEDARELMEKVARENDKLDLVQFLTTAEGRYRVRALRHLAGGNHRMYVMLSEFLSKESLDGLVECFEELADELTPYFQERVGSLSPQQGRIVQTLCGAEGAMTVKEVAEETFIAERNVSKQLGELKQKGYVRSEKRGKESYYDMAEPLMRLCLEVKKQRGEPLKLVAAFLRVWYSDSSFERNSESSCGLRSLEYLKSSSTLPDALRREIDEKLMYEYIDNLGGGDLDAAARNADELIYADPPTGLFARGLICSKRGEAENAIADYSAAIDSHALPAYMKLGAFLLRARAYEKLRRPEEVICDCSAVTEMKEPTIGEKARAVLLRAPAYLEVGKREEAIADYAAVANMKEIASDQKADALLCRAAIYSHTHEYMQSVDDINAVMALPDLSWPKRTFALFYLVEPMIPIKPLNQSIESLQRAFQEGDRETSEYGGDPDGVLRMLLRREHQSWPEFIEKLIPVYAEYNALDKLGSGLTESIAALDEGDYSKPQLDLWNSSWQKFGGKHEELSIPLKALEAAVQTIKTGNDRPLFRLPLEIRDIVRPLLKKTLSGV